MKIAAISDIHGNLPALEAVLADIDSVGVDHLVCSGDIVLWGPDDRACWARIKQTGTPIIRGNTERYVADFGTERADPAWAGEQFMPLQYAVNQFSDEEREELGRLPATYRIREAPDVLFCHASPRNDRFFWQASTGDPKLEKNFGGLNEVVFVGGHSHTQQTRRWRKHTLVQCGSVASSNDHGAGAQYALFKKLDEE